MSNRNPRATAPYAEHDIGHYVDKAAEVRLRVYATENAGVRPMMRFVVGRVINFGGERRVAEEGHWTQTAPYLTDIDPLRLYEALVAQQKELSEFQKMWDERKKKEQPALSCFELKALKFIVEPAEAVTHVLPLELEVEDPTPAAAETPKPKRAKKPKPAPEATKAWTPAEVMAFFQKR